MRRSIARAALASCFLAPLTAVDANDLLDTYRKALDQDTTLAAARFARDAAIEARPQALSAFLPQLNAGVNIARARTRVEQQDVLVLDPSNPPPTPDDGVSTFWNTANSYQVTLSQTIWSFEAWRRLKQSDAQVALAEANFRSAQQALILRVAQAYFGALSASDAVRTNTAERDANERQLLQAKKRFEVGLAAITDVQEAQAAYDGSVATLIGAERTLSNARRALAEITGGYTETAEGLIEEIPLASPNPVSVDDWLKVARDSNFDLQIAELNTEIARKGVGVAYARHYPTLGLDGSYGENDNSFVRNPNTTRSQVGLTLNVPIFSGGLTQSQVRQATATQQQAEAQLEGSKRSIERQTRDAYQGVMSGIASVKANLQAVKSNQTALESSQVGLQVGTRTEVDVLNTLRNLYVAQRSYYQSRYDYLISVLTLKQQAGRLTEADLADIDRLLLVPAAK
ncbi:TolC family outer membrane protein [Nevskia sp.]|uniref:TolC family outer membrane protein n=1 Tax=Nevskia sp. TaxID=1929292 RepID=UPI003F72FD75